MTSHAARGLHSGVEALHRYRREFARFPRNGKLLLASTLLGSLSVGSFSVGYNLYLVELGIAENRLGFLVGAGSLAAAAVAIPAGLVASRIGLKALILWAYAALAVGTALQMLPRSSPVMLVGWNVAWAAGSAVGGALLGAGLTQTQFALTAVLYALASIGLLAAFRRDPIAVAYRSP